MRFILHMGNYKTGSTALQNFLHQNSDILAKYGIYYGNTDPSPLCSHASFTYGLLRITLQKLGLFEPYASHPMYQYISQTPEEILKQIQKEAASKQCEAILLSHEAIFCEAWRTLNGLRRSPRLEPFSESDILQHFHQNLYDILRAVSPQIQVIIYLRRQDDYLESQYNQYIRSPWWEKELQLPDFTEFLSLHPVTLDYTKPLEIIKNIYGIETMTVLAYQRSSALYDDFITQVLKLPADSLPNFRQPEAAMDNRSISYDIIDFKCKFLSQDAALHPDLQARLTEYNNLYPDPQNYTYFTQKLHDPLIRQYRESNLHINDVYMAEHNVLPAFDSLAGRPLYTGITPENLQKLVEFLSSQPVSNEK